jgi:hypothetical protein
LHREIRFELVLIHHKDKELNDGKPANGQGDWLRVRPGAAGRQTRRATPARRFR